MWIMKIRHLFLYETETKSVIMQMSKGKEKEWTQNHRRKIYKPFPKRGSAGLWIMYKILTVFTWMKFELGREQQN